MNVVFLGGASGIGASCLAVEIGERWVLVDAGVRMDPNADRLPDLAFLQGKQLSAIFVTHAHADHIGAIPLVHQAFPRVPIYASRATMYLMEVMLADALQVMAKRASTAFEVPLYNETLVTATLHSLRPLPLTGTLTIGELPDVTIHTSRAGHVAGAIMLGFDAPDGRLLISGDVSVTPQRTVGGALLPSLHHPDLFILESTYGTRLHPNRQAEEERLAQTVAEGIARGGHVLIPAFALGRAQEVLRILSGAQRRGQVPEFPVWVDGLVRTVCSTYTAIPEALTPTLQKQIQQGYPPFFTTMVRSVDTPRQRERILQGSPSCIVSSSGMLTGGPSAYYASVLAENPDASILITGYQDEESPGRRLLSLAEQGSGTLDVNGQTVTVRCRFDRYNLSAHADGSELAALVSTLKPKAVALVHGDTDARTAMMQRLERVAEVILPTEGQAIPVQGRRKSTRTRPIEVAAGNGSTTHAISHLPPTAEDLPRLWLAVANGSGTQIVSERELALAWFGMHAGAGEESAIQSVLQEQHSFFIPVPDLPGMYRVQASESVADGSQAHPQALKPGMLVLLRLYGEKLTPALCTDLRPDALHVLLPDGNRNRTRYPRTQVIELLGLWTGTPLTDVAASRQALANVLKESQRWQRQHPTKTWIAQMETERAYSLDEIGALVGTPPDELVGRVALALLLNETPRLFLRHQSEAAPYQSVRYVRHVEWQAALAQGIGEIRPDQNWIMSVIERHLGKAPDLYRRGINPETGEVTLYFHFPAIARECYADALKAAADEAGVTITIAPQPHQGALTEAVSAVLPEGVKVVKTSLHHDSHIVRLRCSGKVSVAALQEAIRQYREKTGWTLDIALEGATGPALPLNSPHQAASALPHPATARLDMQAALSHARALFGDETGCYKIGVDQARGALILRFYFPDVARERYAEHLEALSRKTGWLVTVYAEAHQGQMEIQVRQLLPNGLALVGAPSLHRANRQVIVRYQGNATSEALAEAQAAFAQRTGWQLLFQRS